MRQSLQWAGGALCIAGVLFVILRLQEYAGQIDWSRFGGGEWAALLALSLVYGAANILLALAWWHLLRHFNVSTSRAWATRVFGISQIAKYVPGNLFHLAGRQAMGIAAGLPGRALAKSMAWELGLLAATGALFALLVMPLTWRPVSALLATLAFLAAFTLCVATVRRLGSGVAAAMVWHGLFLALSGLVFLGVLLIVAPANQGLMIFFLPMVGAYVLAWLAGLLTPGAPAGVGVRELVLILLAGTVVPEAQLLVAVILGRLVTVLGDGLFFAAAYTMQKPGSEKPGSESNFS